MKKQIVGIPIVLTLVLIASVASAFITLPFDTAMIMAILGLYVAIAASKTDVSAVTDMAVVLSVVSGVGSIALVGSFLQPIVATLLPFLVSVAVVGSLMKFWKKSSL